MRLYSCFLKFLRCILGLLSYAATKWRQTQRREANEFEVSMEMGLALTSVAEG